MTAINSAYPSKNFDDAANLLADDVYVLPASVAQQRFWFLDQIEPGNSSLNMPLAFSLSGALNAGALERTLNEIIWRHEILRTTFTTEDDKLMQVIAPEMLLNLEVVDLSNLAEAARAERAEQLRVEEAHTTFDLHCGPLLKAKLVRLAETDHMLLLTMHHVVCDGWSNGVLVRELGEIYGAFSQGLRSPLADLPIQYGDFALWQQEWLESEGFDEQLAYWKQQLGNELPMLNIPTDFPRNRNRSSFGAIESLLLSHALTRAIKALSQREDVTPFMIFLAAFKVLLHRYSGQRDILIGSPTANRIQSETEGLIGTFANTLMLKTDFSGDPTFKEVLQRVKEISLGAFSNQSLPFEKLIEEIKPAQARSSNKLFQVLFIFQTAFMQPVHLKNLTISPMRSVSPGSIFELSLGVVERAEGVRLQMEYNTDLFVAETIKRMLGHLQNILRAAVTDIHQKVSEIPFLTPSERDLLLEGNQMLEDFPSSQTLSQAFESQAKVLPDKIAMVSEAEQISYRELTRRADELALYLQSLGAGYEERVGIRLESPIETAIALLGALQAGCVVIPLNPNLVVPVPCRFMISREHFADCLNGSTLVSIDGKHAGGGSLVLPETTPESVAATVLAYDGNGAVITHRALLARSAAIIKETQLTSADTVLITDSFGSCSTLEMTLAALIAGASLVSVPVNSSADDLLRLTSREQASIVALPAALFHRLSSECELPSSVRVVITGGARVSPFALKKWFGQQRAKARLLISYGTPETGCSAALIEPGNEGSSLRLNRSSPNTQIYILDSNLQPVPAGVPGEVFISGETIATSHFHEEAAPLIASIGKKAFGTKHTARYLPNGEIEILCGEQFPHSSSEAMRIEDTLSGHEFVRESKVMFREDHLAAYVAMKDGESFDESALRILLAEKVTDATLPITFVRVSSLPLTSQGQIDYSALPDAEAADPVIVEPEADVADHTVSELKEIWKEFLGVSSVGIKDDFFELGGHSLAAAKLFEQINKRLGVNLPLVTMFKATTIEQLARIIRKEKPKEQWSSLVPINPNGLKPPLFVIHAAGGNVLFYKDLATRLGSNQPVYGLQPKGLDGNQKVLTRIEDMAAHYLKEIKEVQPQGPYCFGGSSFGGLVAYEMAVQLREGGEETALVALFDTYAPGYPILLPGRSRLNIMFSRLIHRIEHHVDTLRILESPKRWPYIVAKVKKARNQFRRTIKNTRKSLARGVLKRLGRPLPEALKETQNAIITASLSYCPRPYSGTVTLFRADKQPSGIYPNPTLGWDELVKGRLEIHEVPGSHGTIVVEPRVRFLIEKLGHCIERAASSESAMAVGD